MSRRYLTQEEAETRLRLGRPVEQWLGRKDSTAGAVLRWLRIEKDKSGHYTTTLFEVLDAPNLGIFDIYEFQALDVDNPFGTTHIAESEALAIDHAVNVLGAERSRFVNAGVVQDEYRDTRSSESQ